MPNRFHFRNANQFCAFIKEIKLLRDLVKCPVCKELIKNPVRISCDHVFCKHCLDVLINIMPELAPKKRPQCPVCQKTINRQRDSTSNYVKSLLVFLHKTDVKIKSTFNCDVLDLSNEDIQKVFEDISSKELVDSCVKSLSSEDSFDKLLNLDVKNKYSKNYGRKIVNKDLVQSFDKFKPLRNNELKRDVQNWLESTKNDFEHLTQNYYAIEEVSTQESTNLTSITQKNSTNKKTKRPRSLEIKSNSSTAVKLMRRSTNDEQSQKSNENNQKETVEVNKENVLRLLEEECLDNIDFELGVKEKKTPKKVRGDVVNKSSSKRSKKIKKSGKKNIKKIDVTITSPVNNQENLQDENKENIKKKPFTILSGNDFSGEYSKIDGKLIKETASLERKINLPNFNTKTPNISSKKRKLTKSFDSEELCSMQCLKEDHNHCRIENINFKQDSKLTLDKLIDKDTQTNYSAISACVRTDQDLIKTAKKSISIQTDNFICKNCSELKEYLHAAVQTNITLTSSLSQTELLNNKRFSSIEIQTEDLNIVEETNLNNNDDIFEFKTQTVEEQNQFVKQQVKSPLAPTQKIHEKYDLSQDILEEFKKSPTFNLNKSREDLNETEFTTKHVQDENISVEKTTPTQKIEINQNLSQNCIREYKKTPNLNSNDQREHSFNSRMSFSLTNKKICSKEECEERIAEVSKKYKRIRVESDDESGDEENMTRKIKKNKYLVDDLSIEMISENVTDSLSLKNCNEIDYNAYLKNIMKKYDQNVEATSSVNKTKSQSILDKCDAMIKDITSVQPKRDVDETIKPNNDKNENLSFKGSPIDLEIIQEFNKPFSQKLSNEINKISNTLPCTETFMENLDVEELERNFNDKNVDKSVDGEMKSAAEMKSANEHPPIPEKNANIIILQNLLISKPYDDDDRMSATSEDLFTTESPKRIDEDIIESSPKKFSRPKQRSSLIQLKQKPVEKYPSLPPPLDSPNEVCSIAPFLDQTFTPPVDFQDPMTEYGNLDGVNEGDCDVTVILPNPTDKSSHSSIINLCTAFHNSTKRNENDANAKDNSPTFDNNSVINLCSMDFKAFDESMDIPSGVKQLNKEITKKDKMDISITETELLELLETQNASKTEMTENDNVVTSTQNSLCSKQKFKSLEISPIRIERRKQSRNKNPLEIAEKSKFSPLDVVITDKGRTSSLHQKQQSILSFVQSDKIDQNESIISIKSLSPTPSSSLPKISCTRLNKDQMKLVVALAKKKIVNYSNTFTQNITHVICSTNKENRLQDHTMKLLKAIAYGKWVLNFDWIKDSLAQNRIMPEANYEALDMSGLPGPKMSRVKGREKPLLKGFKIYLQPPFMSASKEDVEELIMELGGVILKDLDDLGKTLGGLKLIVAEANGTQDYYKFEEWQRKYKVFVVDIEWLSRSIGQYRLVSLRAFALCSDDNIQNLGYPRELTVEASFSFSQAAATNR